MRSYSEIACARTRFKPSPVVASLDGVSTATSHAWTTLRARFEGRAKVRRACQLALPLPLTVTHSPSESEIVSVYSYPLRYFGPIFKSHVFAHSPSMSPPVAAQPGYSKYPPQWALGFALALETIPKYAEFYDGPVNPFTPDAPMLKEVHEWIRTIFWMGEDLTKFCGAPGETSIEVYLCYPRTPSAKRLNNSEGLVPPPPTASAPLTSHDGTPSKPSDTPDTSCATQDSSLIAVVAVALVNAGSWQQAQELLLLWNEVDGSFPLETRWEKIVDRLQLPEVASIPCLYQVWDSDVGAIPEDKASEGP